LRKKKGEFKRRKRSSKDKKNSKTERKRKSKRQRDVFHSQIPSLSHHQGRLTAKWLLR